jgi:HdeA/HdeB family
VRKDVVIAREDTMKNIDYKLAAIVLLASVAMNANAVTVKDAPSCSEWNPKEATHRIWIEAYLSGIAMEKNDNFLERVSLEKIVQWVSNYCKANPKGEVAVAGVQLSLELMKRHVGQPPANSK